MSFYDWMLALHLLAAFALAAGLVLYAVLLVAGRRAKTIDDAQLLFRIAPVGAPLTGAGAGLALVFGIVLALKSGDFEIWNGWIIAAFVLWALLAAVGGRTGAYYTAIQKRAEARDPGTEQEVLSRLHAPTGAILHSATTLVFVLLLLDMLFKPGA